MNRLPGGVFRSPVLVGRRPDRTRRALGLAVALFVVTSTARAIVLPNAHDPQFLFDLVSALLDAFTFVPTGAPIALGPLTVAGLAATTAG